MYWKSIKLYAILVFGSCGLPTSEFFFFSPSSQGKTDCKKKHIPNYTEHWNMEVSSTCNILFTCQVFHFEGIRYKVKAHCISVRSHRATMQIPNGMLPLRVMKCAVEFLDFLLVYNSGFVQILGQSTKFISSLLVLPAVHHVSRRSKQIAKDWWIIRSTAWPTYISTTGIFDYFSWKI